MSALQTQDYIWDAKGREISLSSPDPDTIDINTINSTLMKIIRFGGRMDVAYTVAAHSAWCYRVAKEHYAVEDPRVLRGCLLHDAAEAYLGDVCNPLKKRIGTVYSEIEARFNAVIAEKYDADLTHPMVKKIDQEAFRCEVWDLFPNFSDQKKIDAVGQRPDMPPCSPYLRYNFLPHLGEAGCL